MIERNLFPQFRSELGYHQQVWDALRNVGDALGYQPHWHIVPDFSNSEVIPLGRFEARLSVPVQSYFWAMAAYSEQAAGFRVQVLDLGSRAEWFAKPIRYENISGQGSTPEGIAFPLYVPAKPFLVLEPGLISVQIENLADVANQIQLVLFAAEPVCRP